MLLVLVEFHCLFASTKFQFANLPARQTDSNRFSISAALPVPSALFTYTESV
jgi:hypothetical protein